MPAWLQLHRNTEEIMDRIDPIPTAMIPPELPLPAQNGKRSLTLEQAAELHERYETEKAQWTKLAEESVHRLKDLDRNCKFYELELAQAKNDKQTLQAMVYDLQQRIAEQAVQYEQRIAELEALASECHALTLHAAARYENAKIPPAIRKRIKRKQEPQPEAQEVNAA